MITSKRYGVIHPQELLCWALVKFGNGVSAISGKVAGNVFARNKAGAYIRNWAKPTSTPTIPQSSNRVRFGNQSASWGSLSQDQRTGWNTSAAGLQRINRMGDPYTPTGRQVYLEANNNNAVASAAPLPDSPVDFTPPELSSDIGITMTSLLGVLTTVDGAAFDASGDTVTVVEAIAPHNGVKQNFANVYRQIGLTDTDATPDLLTMYSDAYGTAVSPGQLVNFRLHSVEHSNGMSSAYLILQVTITGT